MRQLSLIIYNYRSSSLHSNGPLEVADIAHRSRELSTQHYYDVIRSRDLHVGNDFVPGAIYQVDSFCFVRLELQYSQVPVE